jgi:hypothetical protein
VFIASPAPRLTAANPFWGHEAGARDMCIHTDKMKTTSATRGGGLLAQNKHGFSALGQSDPITMTMITV